MEERCDCCYHGMELPPEILEAGRQSLHSDQTEGVREVRDCISQREECAAGSQFRMFH